MMMVVGEQPRGVRCLFRFCQNLYISPPIVIQGNYGSVVQAQECAY